MSKVFGYPEYDEKGEKILTTYDNEYKAMMMDIRVYRMKAGETRTFLREGEETAVLLLSGNITYKWNGNEATATRKDVFTEGPWCVHGCTGTEITVVANLKKYVSGCGCLCGRYPDQFPLSLRTSPSTMLDSGEIS